MISPIKSPFQESVMKTVAHSDFVFAILSPFNGKKQRIKVLKNRHNGKLGEMNKNESIDLLIEMISKMFFSNTSGLGLYEEMFRLDLSKNIKKVFEKYTQEEKTSDNI